MRLVKGARSVKSEWKSRSRGSRRNWRRLGKKDEDLLQDGIWETRATVVQLQMQARVCLPSRKLGCCTAHAAQVRSKNLGDESSTLHEAAESQWDGRGNLAWEFVRAVSDAAGNVG